MPCTTLNNDLSADGRDPSWDTKSVDPSRWGCIDPTDDTWQPAEDECCPVCYHYGRGFDCLGVICPTWGQGYVIHQEEREPLANGDGNTWQPEEDGCCSACYHSGRGFRCLGVICPTWDQGYVIHQEFQEFSTEGNEEYTPQTLPQGEENKSTTKGIQDYVHQEPQLGEEDRCLLSENGKDTPNEVEQSEEGNSRDSSTLPIGNQDIWEHNNWIHKMSNDILANNQLPGLHVRSDDLYDDASSCPMFPVGDIVANIYSSGVSSLGAQRSIFAAETQQPISNAKIPQLLVGTEKSLMKALNLAIKVYLIIETSPCEEILVYINNTETFLPSIELSGNEQYVLPLEVGYVFVPSIIQYVKAACLSQHQLNVEIDPRPVAEFRCLSRMRGTVFGTQIGCCMKATITPVDSNAANIRKIKTSDLTRHKTTPGLARASIQNAFHLIGRFLTISGYGPYG